MMKNRVLPVTVLGALLVIGGAMAQRPPRQDIDPALHPNLAAAQNLCLQAFERVSQAQRANEWDMDGHAQRAKEMLDQVGRELKEAALNANRNHK